MTTSADPHHRLPTIDPGLTPQEDKDPQILSQRLVLKLIIKSTQEKNASKLGPNWEGP